MLCSNLIPKTVLIAGGTQGLGREIALHFSECGTENIIVCGRDQKNGENTVREILKKGVFADFVRADLSLVSGCRTVAHFCEKKTGAIDGLVYAAGVTDRGTIETTT